MSTCDDQSHCQQAELIADRAVKRVFAILGVDVDNPEKVADFQDGLRFASQLRKARDNGFLGMIAAFCIALGAAAWAGFISQIKGH